MSDNQLYDTLDADRLKKPGYSGYIPQPDELNPPPGLAPKIGITEDQPSLSDFGASKSVMPRSVLGTDVAPGQQISDKQMPKAEKLATDPKAEEKFSANQDFHNQLRQFGDQKSALDHIMPTNIKDPNYLQDLNSYRAARGAVQENEAKFKLEHPWGTPGNHPGFWGKLGHTLAAVGNAAGEAIAPNVAAAIPGSHLNLEEQAAQGAGGIKEAEGEQAGVQKAQAALDTSAAHQQEADTNKDVKPRETDIHDRLATTHENPLQNQLGEAVRAGDTEKAQQILDMLKQEKSAQKPMGLQDKQGTDGRGALARAIFNPDPAAPNGGHYTHLDGSPFPDFKPTPTPTTNPQVPVFLPGSTPGSAKLQEIHPGQEFNATNAINPAQLTATNKSVVAEQGSMNSIKAYQQNFQQERPHLTPADVESLKVLTSHAQAGFANQLFQDAGSGVLDALVGQPFTNYTQKLMQGTMTAEQYGQMSPAAKKMLFGYSHAIVANFVNMKQKLGSIGRNPDQIQAEMANIPVPYIDTNAANVAFNDTLRDAQATTFNPFGGGAENNQPQPTAPTGGLEGRPSFADWKKQQGAH
jgi:hypothetical protein